MTTIPSVTEQHLSWMELYLLSGVEVHCPSHAAPVSVWRLTFRCEIQQRDTDNVDCAYPTASGEWHVGGGLSARPVPDGSVLAISGGATTGFWFVSN